MALQFIVCAVVVCTGMPPTPALRFSQNGGVREQLVVPLAKKRPHIVMILFDE